MTFAASTQPLARAEWLAMREQHREIVEPWVQPRLERRSVAEKHPIDDFLFEYYPISANKLLTWHPGFECELESEGQDFEFFPHAAYEYSGSIIRTSHSWLTSCTTSLASTTTFLRTTFNRPMRNGCFGLHEWAMVLGEDSVRHNDWQLRLSQDDIRSTIDDVGLRCTHFDAFRFFAPEARPLNPLQLTRDQQGANEQPGCLHANMDLYKYAQSFAPISGSDLVRDCFALAKEIRTVDMQAAPYDFSALHVEPIKIETVEGRATFAQLQRDFGERANMLRERLIHRLDSALVSATQR